MIGLNKLKLGEEGIVTEASKNTEDLRIWDL